MQPPLEVDPDETDYPSTDSTSTSLASSILQYEYRHGRRYAHASSTPSSHSILATGGTYYFPNDQPEQDRLDMIHHVFYRLLGDRLFLAPIDLTGKRVLDIGTGTGTWPLDVGDAYPGAEAVVGVDISPIQPAWVPPNVKFYVDDVEKPWVENTPYDFIHCRYMAGSIRDWARLVQQCFENLAPGGWIEFHETENTLYSDDGSLEGHESYMVRMMEGLMRACDMIGQTMNPAPSIRRLVEEAGFVNVSVERIKLPVGSWPKDRRLKECGSLMRVNFVEGVDAFTAALFPEILGWEKEQVQALNAGVRREALDGNVHAIFDLLVVKAQKP
ncbi:hypothetical protein N8T08_008592 [Aspergillus melleus]|uniref:Uncharacterized protein n=1 Tax=Aspergillus melleus TaxID=138277 RepID=A0ACC3BDW5_9EURO|nr:hypothetical protein N8T08_008592 [Aspergillus melleus]